MSGALGKVILHPDQCGEGARGGKEGPRAEEGGLSMGIDAKLLEILACPDCKTKVVTDEDTIVCANGDCRRSYSITDGFPVMLIDESVVLEPDKWNALMGKAN